eukprot:Gb_28754 [translate_table: standard]
MATAEVMISQNVPARKNNSTKKRKKNSDEGRNNESDVAPDNAERGSAAEEDNNVYGEKRRKKKNKPNKERRLQLQKEEAEQQRLESLLFGTINDPAEFVNGLEENPEGNAQENKGPVWFTDKSPGGEIVLYEEDLKLHGKNDIDEEPERKPAWIDEEEAETKVNITRVSRLRKLRNEEKEDLISGTDYVNRLRSQHAKLNPGTQWAQLDRTHIEYDSDSESDIENGFKISKGFGDPDYDILRGNEDLVVTSRGKLLPGQIEYSRLRDANAEDPSNAVIQSVEFHRNAQLLLTAGFDKKLKFFQIDGKRNPKIQSIFVQDFPIHKASFLPDGSQAIIAGRRKFFYSFDVVKGKLDRASCLVGREEKSLESFEVSPDSSTIAFLGNEGYILLVSSKTKQLIGTLKMNGSVRAVSFAENGRHLLSSGGDGQVYHWDLRTRKCFHKGDDEGCVNSSALSVSPNSNYFATGSDSGIVNVYNRDEFLGGVKKPLKSLANLVTVVDNLKFNCDSQILAICSRMKRDNLKLVHLPSCTVFSNWPSPKAPLQYVHSMDFSPGGGFMAVGNAEGKVLLYKLHHYQRA